MEIWYKTTRYSVTPQAKERLQSGLTALLMQLRKMALANLHEDGEAFYVKTANSVLLQAFLDNHGFEQVEKPDTGLNAIDGV